MPRTFSLRALARLPSADTVFFGFEIFVFAAAAFRFLCCCRLVPRGALKWHEFRGSRMFCVLLNMPGTFDSVRRDAAFGFSIA